MHVQVKVAVEIASQPEATRARAHIRHGGLRRLLHDVTELAGERQLAFAVDYAGFRAQDRAANFRPRETSNEADFRFLVRQRVPELDHAQEVIHVLARDGDREVLAFLHHFARNLAADVADLALEIAYASFPRIRADQRGDGIV